MKSDNVKFFPFSPGLPWKIKHGRYVVPEVPLSLLTHHIKNREIVVCAFGGLIESYYSLSILEVLNNTLPKSKLFWAGHKGFHSLVDKNGLAKPFSLVTESDMARFPVPVFFDKENRAYFNCLNNYIDVKTYYLSSGYSDERPAVKQIIEKSMFPLDQMILPQFRHQEEPEFLDFYLKASNIQIGAPFVLAFPDSSSISAHDVDCLGWAPREINALAAMLSQSNVQLIVMTEKPSRYVGSLAKIMPLQLNYVFHMMPQASAVLSKDVDFLFIANNISEAALFSLPYEGALNIEKNNNFIGAENVIYVKEEIFPHEVLSEVVYLKGQQ